MTSYISKYKKGLGRMKFTKPPDGKPFSRDILIPLVGSTPSW